MATLPSTIASHDLPLPDVLVPHLRVSTARPAARYPDLRRCVLSMGDDPYLLGSRELVLRSCGLTFLSIFSTVLLEDEVIGCIDLLVMCHTLRERRPTIARTIRAVNPGLPILLLTPVLFEEQISNAHTTSTRPEVLLREIGRTVGGSSSAGRGAP